MHKNVQGKTSLITTDTTWYLLIYLTIEPQPAYHSWGGENNFRWGQIFKV